MLGAARTSWKHSSLHTFQHTSTVSTSLSMPLPLVQLSAMLSVLLTAISLFFGAHLAMQVLGDG